MKKIVFFCKKIEKNRKNNRLKIVIKMMNFLIHFFGVKKSVFGGKKVGFLGQK
jgi:predicted TIM-barrel fold metal-dependent hydrolase